MWDILLSPEKVHFVKVDRNPAKIIRDTESYLKQKAPLYIIIKVLKLSWVSGKREPDHQSWQFCTSTTTPRVFLKMYSVINKGAVVGIPAAHQSPLSLLPGYNCSVFSSVHWKHYFWVTELNWMWEEVTDNIFTPNSEKPPSRTGTLPFLDGCDVDPYSDSEIHTHWRWQRHRSPGSSMITSDQRHCLGLLCEQEINFYCIRHLFDPVYLSKLYLL